MTEFDPKLTAEILERRHRSLENQGAKVGAEIYTWLWRGAGFLAPTFLRQLEDERDGFYKQADRTKQVLYWLYGEIEQRRTPAERIWLEIEDEFVSAENFGEQMVQDVLDAGTRLDILTIKP